MKYRVIKSFGFLNNGDELTLDNNGYYINEKESERGYSSAKLNEAACNRYVNLGYLAEVKDTEKYDTLINFIDDKLEQYKEDHDKMNEAYNNQEVPTCVKVEADTVYYNMTKILNKIKEMINE